MRRSTHQFRPGTLESFEDRVVPSVTFIPASPFNPGVAETVVPSTALSVTTDFSDALDDNVVRFTVRNVSGTTQTASIGAYNSPGGGPPPGVGNNLFAQKLIDSSVQTRTLAPGASFTFVIDADDLRLNGRERFQVDIFSNAGTTAFVPPEKFNPDLSVLSGHLAAGYLFDHDNEGPGNSH